MKAGQGRQKLNVFALDVSQKRNDKILALLIDFPDLPWDDNQLTPALTDMYYKSYTPDHYQTLLFSDTGYTGPDGQNLISMRQYYHQESGDSYGVSGKVLGWYHASHNAAYYGGILHPAAMTSILSNWSAKHLTSWQKIQVSIWQTMISRTVMTMMVTGITVNRMALSIT